MRLKFVPGARELIEQHPELIYDDVTHRPIFLDNFFPKKQPLSLEIGMGKGQFIYQMAKQNPNQNFLGIEKFDSAIVKALEKLLDEPLPNLRLIRMDAQYITEMFEETNVEAIYLNFSDPWPKARHAKRRLTNKRFLTRYEEIVIPGGDLYFKTDNEDLFIYSVDSMSSYGMEIVDIQNNIHENPRMEIITTEFEDKFVAQGIPIKYVHARFKEGK